MGSLVTALQKIQSQFGYLKREALEQYSEQSGVPLYRLHSVASFFPHFQLTPPKPVTLKICRDMACHMAGSGQILRDLKASLDNGARMIQRRRRIVSRPLRSRARCMRRCDRIGPRLFLFQAHCRRAKADRRGLVARRTESRKIMILINLSRPRRIMIDPYAGNHRNTARSCVRSKFAIRRWFARRLFFRKSPIGRRTILRVSAPARCKRNRGGLARSGGSKHCVAGIRKTTGRKDRSWPVGRRFF